MTASQVLAPWYADSCYYKYAAESCSSVECVCVLSTSSSGQDKSMYDASHEMQYLDMVVEETLRVYPPAAV